MNRRLPPLNGLRAFEAAARYLSFTKAAEELHVTPAAVSQQVKSLESYFGVKLFRRLTRALLLTDAGQMVLPVLRDGFDKLAESDRLLRSRQDENVITVSVPPSFGAKWLVPRLDSFRRRHPEYDIRMDATDTVVDFKVDSADLAIRYGRGRYRGLHVEPLLAEHVFPVCSPELQRGDHPINTPTDLRHHVLIHIEWKSEYTTIPSWEMWLRAAGVTGVDATRGPRFSMESLAVQAALESQGVALVSSPIVARDIAMGRLLRPFPETINAETQFCYYIVCPESHITRPKVATFRDWLHDEARTPG